MSVISASAPPALPRGVPPQIGYMRATWVWSYTGPTGRIIGHVVRYDGDERSKKVIPYFIQKDGQWAVGAPEAPRPLFGLSNLPKDTSATVYVVEGEKCAQALLYLGFPAVTSLDGSHGAEHADWTPLRPYENVVVLPDNDKPGEHYAAQVTRILRAQNPAALVRVARLPELLDRGDVVDWLQDHTIRDWDGYGPIPREPGDDLSMDLLEVIETFAEPAGLTTPAAEETPVAVQESWDKLIPLNEYEPEPWPGDVFPDTVQKYVDAVSAATETPPELAATMALAVLATTVQGRYRVRVKEGYSEPLSLWLAAALPSGNRKSSVLDAVKGPLVSWEVRERHRLKPLRELVEADRESTKRRIKLLRRKAEREEVSPKEATDLSREIQTLEKELTPIPDYPRLWTNDATPEALAVLMEKHGGRMAILSDEGGPFDIMAGRYSRSGPNLDVYLQGHAGGSIRVDRLNRESVFLDSAALSLGIAPQPSVLRDFARTPEFLDRGLSARLLPALPESNLGRRTGDGPPVPEQVKVEYEALIHAILDQEPLNNRKTGRIEPYEIWLPKEAAELWHRFERANEAKLGPNGVFHHMTDWGGKLPGQVARLAAVLHVARSVSLERAPHRYDIDAVDMAAAIRMGRYFESHALRLYALIGADPVIEDAVALLDWIKRQARDSRTETGNDSEEGFSFSRRDAQRAMQARFQHSRELDAPLDILKDRGYVRERLAPGPRKPGRPSEVYEVNPAVLVAP